MTISIELIKSSIGRLNGFLPVYKPAGMCSHRLTTGLRLDMHYIAERCDINLGEIYSNHARDLEPFAEGLVTFIIGNAKRARKNFVLANYMYNAKIEFGVERQYHSIDGRVLSRSNVQHIDPGQIERALPKFTGLVTQGRCPSYRLIPDNNGQQGTESSKDALMSIQLFNRMPLRMPPVYESKMAQKYPYTPAPRSMLVESIQLDNYSQPFADFTISCHGEFKVRQFAADLAHLLGTKASVVELSRIKEGPMTKDDLHVFQSYELHVEHYLPRIKSLDDIYRDFNDEIGPLWDHLESG